MHLYLVRHGTTHYNEKEILTGHKNPILSDLGHQQGRLLAQHFRNKGLHTIYYPDSARTKLTADHFRETHPDVVFREEPLFRERTYGIFDGRQKSDIHKHFLTIDASYKKIPYHLVCTSPGAETHQQTLHRASKAIQFLSSNHDSHDTIVVISSSGFINFLRMCLLHGDTIEDTEIYKTSFPAASISYYILSPGTSYAQEQYVAYTGHLSNIPEHS